MTRSRIVVAGGGPVGLALAAASSTFDVRVIEASPARTTPLAEEFDVRVYAISPGSRDFLRDLGAWERIDAKRVAPVRRMEIFGDEGARLAFSARPGASLAWIVEAGRLTRGIEEQVEALENVQVTRGVAAAGFGAEASGSWVELATSERFEAEVLVGADGPDSRVRAALGMAAEEAPYGETAVVANFETEKEHESAARQWFRDDGVLAWLPLPGKRISIVWSTPSAHAEQLAATDVSDFERRVRDAGSSALGDLRLISAVARFPLRSIRVADPVVAGAALVGDAAHAVHPLAGQGVNLGFQDARCLAEVLEHRSQLERPGDLRVLRRYARGRREDVTAMHFVTDSLDRLFASGTPGARRLRHLGLKLVDTQDWAKSALQNRAMR
jgi:ubiquinone biosynthesis UbiH/UbiF/VisC/COQ6 family hydroxylase